MKTLHWLRENWLQLVILAVPFIVIAAAWGRFPDRVAVHWGGDGRPNGWENKAKGLLFCPLMNVALAIFLGWIPRLDPRISRDPGANERSTAAIGVLRLAVTALMSFGALLIAAEALGSHLNMLTLGINALLLMFVVLGNKLGTVRPNYFVGIRTPWTLESDEVWRATHRVTGRILVFGSLAFFGLQFLIKPSYVMPCFVAFFVATFAWAAFYSFWLFRSANLPPPPLR